MKSLSATAPHFSMWLQTVPISPVSQKNWNCRNLWKPRLHPVMSSGALSINWATGNLERSTFYAARILPPLSTKIILWNHCKCTCHKSANYYWNKVSNKLYQKAKGRRNLSPALHPLLPFTATVQTDASCPGKYE